jgi:chromosomal replication initiator protein
MSDWDRIKENLRQRVTPNGFDNWIARTTEAGRDGSTLRVAVPDDSTKLWMEADYACAVQSAIDELGLPFSAVVYELLPAWSPASRSDSNYAYTDAAAAPVEQLFGNNAALNGRFTFDSFVVGSCNQFAHAAAKAVASKPSRSYNPLFIYGGAGMGKTHLIHAIGRSLIQNFAGMRVVYTTSERFVNLMVQCIRQERMPEFQQFFRSADALLIDDIQFIAGKERTQEEFFHTFNELYDHQKQIIVSSDSPPKHVTGLVDRLKSRFEWGLMVDVQPPDLETKMAILDKKAEQEGIALPENVRVFLATKTKSNVRELEGALVKLIAYSSMTNSPITLPMAEHVLRQTVTGTEKKVTIEAVIRAVAERYSLQPAQLRQKTNAWQISFPRQVAMYIAKEMTGSSLPEIGRAFGGKHHTTVLHAIQKIERERERDVDLNRTLHSVMDSLG